MASSHGSVGLIVLQEHVLGAFWDWLVQEIALAEILKPLKYTWVVGMTFSLYQLQQTEADGKDALLYFHCFTAFNILYLLYIQPWQALSIISCDVLFVHHTELHFRSAYAACVALCAVFRWSEDHARLAQTGTVPIGYCAPSEKSTEGEKKQKSQMLNYQNCSNFGMFLSSCSSNPAPPLLKDESCHSWCRVFGQWLCHSAQCVSRYCSDWLVHTHSPGCVFLKYMSACQCK